MSLGMERRWEKYMQSIEYNEGGCWNWTGKIKIGSRGGYGIVRVNYRDVRVHRLFYERLVGPIPENLHVLHRCNNRRCVNPEHLYTGTHRDNMDDLTASGNRQRTRCPNGHELTDNDRPASDGSRCVICRHDRQNRYARRVRAGMAVLLAFSVLLVPMRGIADTTIRRGDVGPAVAEVQTILAGFGYSVVTDSRFGPQTEKAVRSWQRSNGLTVDGIVGNQTLDSLRSARRIGNQMQVTPTVPPPPTGLNGLPFAPEDLSGCAEATFYRKQAGLPDAFDALIWRESGCKNTVTSPTGCCRGWLQLDINLHLRDYQIGPLYRDNCQVFAIADAFGSNPLAKQKHMCAARQLFDVKGYRPWAL
jgi:Putative peptidoglycan binding domain/HNH endonuclease